MTAYKTADHKLGTTTFAQTVLERLWLEAVRKQVADEVVR